LFALSALFSPSHGLIARAMLRRRLRERFAADLLVMHLAHHRTAAETFDSLATELDWSPAWLARVVKRTQADRAVAVDAGVVQLTERGRQDALQIARTLDPTAVGR
jgi:manganese/zinc/iron transport system permease protein